MVQLLLHAFNLEPPHIIRFLAKSSPIYSILPLQVFQCNSLSKLYFQKRNKCIYRVLVDNKMQEFFLLFLKPQHSYNDSNDNQLYPFCHSVTQIRR
jgi:hypothetical protein